MSEAQVACAVILGTSAFTLIIAGGAALAEAEKREQQVHLTDFDPTGLSTLLSDALRILRYSLEWKKENRLALALLWSGVSCGVTALAVAVV